MKPLVSIITPTWRRHDMLLTRCVPSVQKQDYPRVEHVIVSDGPDPELREKISEVASPFNRHSIRFFEIPERQPGKYGCRPRKYGIEKARGGLIGYNDDDDLLRPRHVSRLVASMEADPEARFSVSHMLTHSRDYLTVIGVGQLAEGNIGTPMVLHQKRLLTAATWGEPSKTEDWELFSQWLALGIPYTRVNEITVDAYPSEFRN